MNTISELAWFKSSYSGGDGDDCIEVALDWHKSSHSSGGDGDCVEIAPCPEAIHIRDSKHKQGPHLKVTTPAWTAFVTYAAED